MAIGASWAEVWNDVWGPVWADSVAPPVVIGQSLSARLQAHCRALTGSAGTFNEDLYLALAQMQELSGPLYEGRHLSGLLTFIPGGFQAVLLDPTLITAPPEGMMFGMERMSMFEAAPQEEVAEVADVLEVVGDATVVAPNWWARVVGGTKTQLNRLKGAWKKVWRN